MLKRRQRKSKILKMVYFNTKTLVWIAGVVTALTGAVIGIAKSWEYIEPGIPALRYYVRDQINGSTNSFKIAQQSQTSIFRDLQIENNEGKKAAAANALANWKLEKLKTNDSVTQNLIENQIREKEAEIEKLNSQLRTLDNLKAKGQ